MKTALYLALSASAIGHACVRAEAFADTDKALWIDRHNYFRMSALPYAAGNMLRIKWSDDLATQAQADATACAAKSTGGVNAAVVAATGSAVDAAIQVWVVDAAMGVFPKLAAPKAAGEPVGAGTYNSYSQVVWSATNQVGCAKAACGAQVGVACRYAPAGNDGTSPWYVHAATGTACPDGLVSKVGLCVTSVDDPAYNDIAAIPAGQLSYEVFKDFIPNMQKALKGEAVAPASAATTPAAPAAATPATPAAPAAADAKAPAVPAADGAAPAAPAGAATPAASTAPAASVAPGASATPATTDAKDPTAPAATGTPASGAATDASANATPEPVVTKIVDGKVLVRVKKTTAPAPGAETTAPTTDASATPAASAGTATETDASATPEPMMTKVVDGKVLVRVKKTTAPSAGAGSAAGATPTGPSVGDVSAAPEPSVTKVVDGKVYVRVPKSDNAISNDVVGTVKPSDSTGTTFTNQATTAPAAAAAGTPASAASTTTAPVAPAAGASATGANNKSGGAEEQAAGFSAAGVAGVIVIGCVAVAGVAVFVSYRKNQKRQRDIMQNGGIHVL